MPGLQDVDAGAHGADELYAGGIVVAVVIEGGDGYGAGRVGYGGFDVEPRGGAEEGVRGEVAADVVTERTVGHFDRARASVFGWVLRGLERVERWEEVFGLICMPGPDFAVGGEVADGEVGGGFVLERDLLVGTHAETLDCCGVMVDGADEADVVLGCVVGGGCGVVVGGIAAVDEGADGEELGYVSDSGEAIVAVGGGGRVRCEVPHVVAVEVGEQEVVELLFWCGAEVMLGVAGDPFARAAGGVRASGGEGFDGAFDGASVDHESGSVRGDGENGVSAAGGDVVDVEEARLPGIERGIGFEGLDTVGCGKEECGGGAGEEAAARDALGHRSIVAYYLAMSMGPDLKLVTRGRPEPS